jgi:hypothetical protein
MRSLSFLLIIFCSLFNNFCIAQNVGIGTNNPQFPLDVKGMIRTDSGIIVNNTIVITREGRIVSDTGSFKRIGINKYPAFDVDASSVVNTDSAYYFKGAPILRSKSNSLVIGQPTVLAGGGDNTIVGNYSGLSNTSGSFNTFFGAGSGRANTTGLRNVFIGYNTGLSNTTGIDNVFVGQGAGLSNSIAGGNTFMGNASGQNNSSGAGNAFFGNFAGLNNTTAGANTFIGSQAGAANITGTANTFIGEGAGLNNTTVSFNTFIGRTAGFANTTGGENAFVGAASGQANTTGSNNAFFGRTSGFSNSTGSSNTFIGNGAGYNNTTGNFNTFVGREAGVFGTTGNENTFVGRSAGGNTSTGSLNTMMGYYAGVFNTTGAANTFVGNGAFYKNTGGNYNTSLGYFTGYENIIGTRNTYLGFNAGYYNTGNDNTCVGYQAWSFGYAGTVVVGGNAVVQGNFGIAIGQSSNAGQNAIAIGSGISAATNTIRLGNAATTTVYLPVEPTIVSDKNAKENFKDLDAEDALTRLSQIPISTWNLKGHNAQQNRHYGPMAQDFYAAFGKDGFGTIGSDTTINTHDLSSINTLAIQALEMRTRQIEMLINENALLKIKIKNLEENLASENIRLKNIVDVLAKKIDDLDDDKITKSSAKSFVAKD